LYGTPGIAVSLESYDGSWQFAPLADFVAKNLGALVSLCTKDSFVSVNAASRSSYAGVAVTTLSRRNYLDRVEILDAPDGKRYGFFAGGEIVTGGAAGNDYEAVRDGKISVSLVRAEPETERTDAAVCFVL
ncbi:MAG: 5'/3'-nucleotidase SurE, partial [Treponemataceae bacterium]|nr:5'/3'-nucleotidase SurE [Treponemataceae bacterium]